MTTATDLPVDVVQYIALMNDPWDYLNIALVCEHFSGILKQTQKHPRRAKAIRHFTRLTTNIFGIKTWRLNKQVHRENDKPAIIYPSGGKEWYQYGKCHRDNDKPAYTTPNGTKWWCQNGQRHRLGGKPAIIYSNGCKEWWLNGKRYK